jgi:glycosyltransferase involved in cell wall biosynthesis
LKVLLCVTSTRLAYGGPAVSVTGLADALLAAGLETAVWSPETGPRETGNMTAPAGAPRFSGDIDRVWPTFGRPDLIHDNGIWLPHHRRIAGIAAQQGPARIVSTRGMLSPWALRHKGLKKQLALMLYQRRDLDAAQIIHATGEEEARDLGTLGLTQTVSVIPNGLALPDPIFASPLPTPSLNKGGDTRRTMLYLGRVYPVKGLSQLLDAWADVRPDNWRLLIVGPDEAGHRGELEARRRRLGLEDSIAFHDAVSGLEKEGIYRQADLFVLPSLSESFGMSLAEAMAYGMPVIASTAAPWPMIVNENLGWWVNPTRPDLTRALRAATTTPPETLKAMGKRASDHVRSGLSWKVLVPRYVEMYERAISLKRQKNAA